MCSVSLYFDTHNKMDWIVIKDIQILPQASILIHTIWSWFFKISLNWNEAHVSILVKPEIRGHNSKQIDRMTL